VWQSSVDSTCSNPQRDRLVRFDTINVGENMKSHMKRMLLPAIVAVALGSGIAQGKECKGINFPDQVQVEGSSLSLNGLGLRQATAFKVNVYVAALYVAKPSSDPNALLGSNTPFQLVLQFVRNVGADDVRKGWSEGFEKNAKDQLPALKDRIAMVNGWMADIKTGERLTFTYKPGNGLQVDVNGAVKGTIKGDDFARAFLSIWLGAEPPNPEIKAGMLGGACG
jgi:Chalcone isomerase-like